MAAPGALCACSNISIMQLFHELKQQFPTVPDCVVSSTISSHCHDRGACRRRLQDEARLHPAYPAASLQPQPAPPRPQPQPLVCPNRLSDANQNLLPERPDPLVDDNKCDGSGPQSDQTDNCAACTSDNKNYKISKVSTVKCELNRKLEQDDNDSSLEENLPKTDDELFDVNRVKPKRPDSLRISPAIGYIDKSDKCQYVSNKPEPKFNPDDFDNCRIREKSDGCSPSAAELQRLPNSVADIGISGEAFNVSLNLSCRMDIPAKQRHSQTSDQIQNNFYSPGSYTSVNLTVCTPTSMQNFPMEGNCAIPQNMQTAVSEQRPRGFEGNLQITVNSAPTGTGSPDSKMTTQQTSAFDLTELPSTSLSENIVRRQKIHLDRLERALKADRQRLATMQREINFLKATPPPSPSTARLRYTVHQLHLSCEKLTQQLDAAPRHPGGSDNGEMSNAGQQTEQRNADSERQNWKCHICTYINHADVNQCELCTMPRIILVHSDDEITVQLHPGCNKISRSWII